jgi:uncharacterized membrane protein YgcG
VDTVLGVSMAPSTVRMVLVEGDKGNGVTVEEDSFDVPAGGDAGPPSAPERVISAILGTREGATQGGYELTSTGVTWNNQAEAAALRDLLAEHKMENVMLVSAFLSAAALAQEAGNAIGYDRTGLLFVEPDTATLAVVNSSDGSVSEVRRAPLTGGDPATQLAALVADMQTLQPRPDGLYMVGSGVDIAALKPRLEATTALPVIAPEEPDMALARGAALASAHAPLFESSTMALAYAQDPDTGMFDPYVPTMAYSAPAEGGAFAYSDDAFDESDAPTRLGTGVDDEPEPRRRPLVLVASAVAAIFVVGLVALGVALLITMHPKVGEQHNPGQQSVPSKQAPPPGAPAPSPPAAPAPASAPAPAAPAPAPAAPAPAAPAPAPAAPAPAPAPEAPAPAPAAPAPAPAPAAPPAAPVPIPIPIPVGPPGGGYGPPGGGYGPPGGGYGPPGGGGHVGSGGPGGGFPGGGGPGGGGGGIPGVPHIPGIPGL